MKVKPKAVSERFRYLSGELLGLGSALAYVEISLEGSDVKDPEI